MEAMQANLYPKLSIYMKNNIKTYIIIIVCTFLIAPVILHAQNVTIKGNNQAYAGEKLIFFNYCDRITYLEEEAGQCTVSDNGDFYCTLSLEKTEQVFVYLGLYKGMLYAEPGETYEISLPEKAEKTPKEILNPYFKETEVYLAVLNSYQNELNFIIRQFDDIYGEFIDQYYLELTREAFRKTDTVIVKINKLFSGVDNEYFIAYKDYKLAALRQLAYKQATNHTTFRYLTNKPVLYNNVAYMDLFNNMYRNFFSLYVLRKDGEQLFTDIVHGKSFTKLKKTLHKNMELQDDTLKELVILKGLYDAFYSGKVLEYRNFPHQQLLQTLDSVKILSLVPWHRKIAGNIIKKVTRLLRGFDAPYFELYNKDSILIGSDEFRSRYVYLNFATTLSFACQKDLELLKKLYKNHKKTIEIVTISNDRDFNTMKEYFQEHDYNWTLLHYANQPEILKMYNVKAFPMYYMIDPEGKLIMCPAPTPEEDIEYYLFKLVKPEKDKEMNELFIRPGKIEED